MLAHTSSRPRFSPARNRVARHWAGAWRVALLAAGCSLALGAGDAFAGQLPVPLRAASSYAALAGSTVTSTGLTTLNGDLGVWPGTSLTGFPPGMVSGTVHAGDAFAMSAQGDLTAAYNDAAGRQPPQAPLPADIGGETLTPGVYKTGATPALGVTGTLTLDGQGDPNAVFVIQVGSALTTAVDSHVNLIGGAQPGNVFWQIGSSATLGTSSTFAGTILALTSISINSGVTLNGRALARNGAVTLIGDTINVSTARVPPEVPKEPSYPIQIPAGAEDPAAQDATAADERAQAHFSHVYGGLALINHGTHVVISLTTLDPRIEAAIRGDAPASEFTFVHARRSGAWLEALTQRIGADQAARDAAGVQLIKEGDGDAQTGRLLVQVLNLTPAKRRWLNARYGADNLKVIAGTAADIPVPISGPPRANDHPPWNGGDFITDTLTEDCSSGFGAHRGRAQYMITAGHCFTGASLIRNASGGQQFGNMGVVGVVTRNSINHRLDSELIGTIGGSSKLVFAGRSTSKVRDAVSGTAGSPLGMQVCQDGAFEGKICGLVVKSKRTECIMEGRRRMVCHIFEADKIGGGIASGEGDSGGPVFRFMGSRLYATGIVTAGSRSGERDCPTYQVKGLPRRKCAPKLFYTSIAPILGRYKLTINK